MFPQNLTSNKNPVLYNGSKKITFVTEPLAYGDMHANFGLISI